MKKITNNLFIVLALTVLFGAGAFFLAQLVDEQVDEITQIKTDVDDLTRITFNYKARAEDQKLIDEYKESIDERTAEVSNVINILNQLEVMADIAAVEANIKLEEGEIQEEGLEFEDEKEKEEFLEKIKDNNTNDKEVEVGSDNDQEPSKTNNYVLDISTESSETDDGKIENLTYIEIDVSLVGSYKQVRRFINLIGDSQYLFSIKQIRMNKLTDGKLESTITLRAIIFE